MDETYVINQCKEDTCFVSTDFNADMATAQKKLSENSIIVDYVLPDFTTIRRGYVRSKGEQGSGEQVWYSILYKNLMWARRLLYMIHTADHSDE